MGIKQGSSQRPMSNDALGDFGEMGSGSLEPFVSDPSNINNTFSPPSAPPAFPFSSSPPPHSGSEWGSCIDPSLVACPAYTYFGDYCCETLSSCDTYCGWYGYYPGATFY